jgi:hypothetical protein
MVVHTYNPSSGRLRKVNGDSEIRKGSTVSSGPGWTTSQDPVSKKKKKKKKRAV